MLEMCSSKDRASSMWTPRSLFDLEMGKKVPESLSQPGRLARALNCLLPKTNMGFITVYLKKVGVHPVLNCGKTLR